MVNPSGNSRGRIHQLESSQPDDGNYNRVKRHSLRIQGIVVNARRSLLAATMRRWHLHLPALVLHHAATGTLFGVHLHIGDHAGHCRSQA